MVELIRRKTRLTLESVQRVFVVICTNTAFAITRAKLWIRGRLSSFCSSLETNMISPIQKGVELAKTQTPHPSLIGGLDLRTLPKYISYKAALQKEKATYQTICLVLMGLLCSLFLYSRYETYVFTSMLRQKEYILAPGTFDFTPVRAHQVSDKYVKQTVSEYLLLLGNITPDAVDDQYANLQSYMSKQLSARFAAESKDWITKVKKDDVTETLQVTSKEIQSDGNGQYKLRAVGKRSIFANNQFLSSENEVIEMDLRLIQPASDIKRNWYLEITNLSRKRGESKKNSRQGE